MIEDKPKPKPETKPRAKPPEPKAKPPELKPEPKPEPKLASVTFAEKIAREAGLKGVTIGVLEGGATVMIGSRTFPAADIEAMVRQDEKTADATVRRALGLRRRT